MGKALSSRRLSVVIGTGSRLSAQLEQLQKRASVLDMDFGFSDKITGAAPVAEAPAFDDWYEEEPEDEPVGPVPVASPEPPVTVDEVTGGTNSGDAAEGASDAATRAGANEGDGETDEADAWLIPDEDLEVQEEIGSGMFAHVFAGRYAGKRVAIKKINDAQGPEELRFLEREVDILKEIEHPNIVRLHGMARVAGTGSSLWLVTEFVDHGSLRPWLEKGDGKVPIDWKLRARMGKEVAAALEYLHSLGIIHRDCKSENLLVTRTFHVKLGSSGV